jgi:hypothetical protein
MKTSIFDYDLTIEINRQRARQARRQAAIRGLKILGYSLYCVALGIMLGTIIASL